MRDALRSLLARRAVAATVLLAGATAAIAERTATAGARSILASDVDGAWWRAGVVFLLGGSVGALLGAWARAGAVASATGTPPRDLVKASVRRGISFISLGAVELTILGTLALFAGVNAMSVAALGRGPALSAAAIAFSVAPPILLALLTAAAFRIAMARTAAGVAPERALMQGLALALATLPSLLRFAAVALALTAPLWLGALAAGALAGRHFWTFARVVLFAAQGALAVAASAWMTAGLGVFVGFASENGNGSGNGKT